MERGTAGYRRHAGGGSAVIIREAREEDVRQIAEILVEDWKTAYRGIIDDDYLDAMDAEQRYLIEIRRYREYAVAAEGREVLGYAWSRPADDDEAADCEIVALYVRYAQRNRGIGRALLRHAMDAFVRAGRKTMIVWCLRENDEARRFYEAMGGKADRCDTHPWGGWSYDMISYLFRLDPQP